MRHVHVGVHGSIAHPVDALASQVFAEDGEFGESCSACAGFLTSSEMRERAVASVDVRTAHVRVFSSLTFDLHSVHGSLNRATPLEEDHMLKTLDSLLKQCR